MERGRTWDLRRTTKSSNPFIQAELLQTIRISVEGAVSLGKMLAGIKVEEIPSVTCRPIDQVSLVPL